MNAMNSKAVANIRETIPKRGTAAPANSPPPPPPNFLEAPRAVKKTWLLCLFLFCIRAIPVQSQTAVPTATSAPPAAQFVDDVCVSVKEVIQHTQSEADDG